MIFFAAGCKVVSGSNKNSAADKNDSEKVETRMVTLNPSMEEERRLQKAVDDGWQPWRLNPIDVAHANMINQGVNVRIEDCSLVKKDDAHAVVHVQSKDGKDLNVHVARLVRPDGIWTATQVEINDDGGAQAMEHDHAQGQSHEQHQH